MRNFIKRLFLVKQDKYKDYKPFLSHKDIENSISKYNSNSSHISFSELKDQWLKSYFSQIEKSYEDELNRRLIEIEKWYEEKKSQIILNALSRLDYQNFRDEFIVKVQLTNQEIKGRLVGLNARNKKTFERICGVELIVKENDDYIYLSSANHIKRQIAYLVLIRLIEIKNIEPNKIENYYNEEKINFEHSLVELGKDVLLKTLKLKRVDDQLFGYVGRLRYRYSYGQNVLEHSIESALLAEIIAKKLNVDPYMAKICAFFHDIGKSVDHETGKDHIDIGIEIAKKCHLPNEVISSIQTHHQTYSNNVYDAITKIVDKASAAKPGARISSKDDFYKRVETYEQICYKFPEVKNVWVLQSGFTIKILLKPNSVDDQKIKILGQRIILEFEKHPLTKNYLISVELIKEDTYKFKTTHLVAK